MRKNAEKIIGAFLDKAAAQDKTLRTDGATVWSYAMPIARWEDGRVHVLAYRDAPTATTRSHVRAVAELCRLTGTPTTEGL